MAALYLLRPFWPRMTVYHLDTGDQFPETYDVLAKVEQDLGAPIQIVQSDVKANHVAHGMPSDLVPVNCGRFGRMVAGEPVAVVDRYFCCFVTIMLPMHERMKRDGITLIVRGNRADDYSVAPSATGQLIDGFEFLNPIESWDASRVMAFLVGEGLPVARFYAYGMKSSPDCMGCTAWWGEGRQAYMARFHPVRWGQVRSDMGRIEGAIDRQLSVLIRTGVPK